MQKTWCDAASSFILAPTLAPISPPTLASISSKISTGTLSCAAREVFKASMTREISPLDAIARSGRSGSPGFGAKRKSTCSMPRGDASSRSSKMMENPAFANPRSARWVFTSSESLGEALRRAWLSFFAAESRAFRASDISPSKPAPRSSRFFSCASFAEASAPNSITASTVEPYFRFRLWMVSSRASVVSRLLGSASRVAE